MLLAIAAASLKSGTNTLPAWAREKAALSDTSVRFENHDEAVAEGRRRDIGRVEVLAPAPDR